MEYLAHLDKDCKLYQTILEHAAGTANYAEKFAALFTEPIYGKILGLYHDIGKYSKEFQNYLLHGGVKGSVDHTGAGSIELFKTGMNCKNPTFFLLAMCIAGHHGGLPDMGDNPKTSEKGTFFYRLNNSILPEYTVYKEYLPSINVFEVPDMTKKLTTAFGQMFYARMLYSCLVDADYLDTEAFLSNKTVLRNGFIDIAEMKLLVDKRTSKFNPDLSALNKMRCELLKQCQDIGCNSKQLHKNLYTLTIPTGGGKTLSSLSFALNRAVLTGRQRIIYVIPYTSIIEQNAGVFKDIIGKNNVVEHHMNVIYDYTDGSNRKKLATENWDAPLIVTTNVQFIESIFANKPSKCRKLHNIANSIIIFDEVQMLPEDYLLPCVEVIKELTEHYNCCVVLCTATQPSLDKFFDDKAIEIIDKPKFYYDVFKRTKIKILGKLTESELAGKLKKYSQVLCIVGTKRTAQQIFELLKEEKNVYHLSTNMCPAHRKRILEEIRAKLKNEEVCRVISTSLIEAGVDVDFPTVYKEMDALDSIVQAAGRCNREGKHNAKDSIVYVFELEGNSSNKLRLLEKQVTENILQEYNDISSPEAIAAYFNKLHILLAENLDKHKMFEFLKQGRQRFYFKTIASMVKIINDNTKSIFIPFDSNAKIIERELRSGARTKELMRKMGAYCVNVYYQADNIHSESAYEKLLRNNKIEILDENITILIDDKAYDNKVGLLVDCYNGGLGEFI